MRLHVDGQFGFFGKILSMVRCVQEMQLVLNAGVSPDRVIFAHPCKVRTMPQACSMPLLQFLHPIH